MNLLRRIHSLVLKEFQSLLGNKSGRLLLIMPVVLQTALFPFAATLEVKNASLAILNEDQGVASMEMVQRFTAPGSFTSVKQVWNEAQLEEAIGKRDALLAVRIPPDFSRKIANGETATVQAILDGRRSNSAQITFSYLQSILDTYLKDRALAAGKPFPSEVIVRNWYVPNLEYTHFILPSLVAIITTIGSLIVTALSVAREREQGTFEQLLVSPLSPEIIMLGKAVPAIVIGFFQATLILIAAVFIYQISFRGHLVLLYLGMFFYSIALAGVGLFISSISKTQQQAFLGAFIFMVPAILLSGYTAPVENMPPWLQHVTWFNPVRHFVEISKGVFLKDASPERVFSLLKPLILIGAGTLTAASLMFRRKAG